VRKTGIVLCLLLCNINLSTTIIITKSIHGERNRLADIISPVTGPTFPLFSRPIIVAA
jgi:hypothetical protein